MEYNTIAASDGVVAINEDIVPLLVDGGVSRDRISVIENWASLAEVREKAWLVFLGNSPLEETLRDEAQRLGVENLTFTGFVNTPRLPEHYVMSDVFIPPSTYDPTAKTLNEAVAYGLPAPRVERRRNGPRIGAGGSKRFRLREGGAWPASPAISAGSSTTRDSRSA